MIIVVQVVTLYSDLVKKGPETSFEIVFALSSREALSHSLISCLITLLSEHTKIQNKMELKFTFLLIFLAAKANASSDIVGKCETDFRGKWPQNILDEDLQWVRNSKENKSGPKFRIFTSQDVRRVQPNLAYHCKWIFDAKIQMLLTKNFWRENSNV